MGELERTIMGDISEENTPFLPLDEFLDEITKVHEHILTYTENLEKIDDIQSKLLKGIGWGQEGRKRLSDELDNVTRQNKAIEKEVSTKIKEGYAHKFSTDTEEKIRQEKLKSMATLLIEAITTYKNMDIHYKEKSEQNLVNTIKIRDPDLSEEEIRRKIESNDIESLLSSSIIQETEEAKKQLGEVEDRHKEIKKLEEDIMELAELFNEMMELVQGQGETINNIEEKINTTQRDVRRAVGYLESAKEFYEKFLQKKRVLVMIGAAIFLIFLILIISATTSGSAAEPDNVNVIMDEVDQANTNTVDDIGVCDPNEDPDCVG